MTTDTEVVEAPETPDAPEATPPDEEAGHRRSWIVPLLLVALVVVPLVVTWLVLREPRWISLDDTAQMEMRVRDVGTRQPPALGLAGRITGYGEIGSHPGPVSFYALWPFYKLMGSDGWGLQGASLALHGVAAGLAIWIAYRRGGRLLAAGTTVVLLALAHAYGMERLATAWNPNLPVLWWVLCLLAVWSVLCDDMAFVPLAVFAGAMCMETHLPYVMPVTGLMVLMAVWLVVVRRSWRWGLIGLGLLVVLWLPPVIQQFSHDPGNMTIIYESFRNPVDSRIHFGDSVGVWLRHLNLATLARGDIEGSVRDAVHPDGPTLAGSWPGVLLLVAWAAAAVASWRRRAQAPDLLRLHVVVGLAGLLGLISLGRIYGPVWPYLVFSIWGTAALMALAVGWTVVTLGLPARDRVQWPVLAGVGAVAVVLGVVATVDAAHTEMADIDLSRAVHRLADQTEDRLARDPAHCGHHCRYLVTYVDAIHIVTPAYGMLLELEKHGYDARAEPQRVSAVRESRVINPRLADATVVFVVTDKAIASARKDRGATELAHTTAKGEPPMAVFLYPRQQDPPG